MKNIDSYITERLHINKKTKVKEFYCKNNPKLADKYAKLFEDNPKLYDGLNFLIDFINTEDDIYENWFNMFSGIYITDSNKICATQRAPHGIPIKIELSKAVGKYNEANNTNYYISYAGMVNENIFPNAKLIRNVIDAYKEKFPEYKIELDNLVEINNDKINR